jgi:nicotinate-nucleotide pyrophosphorylase (carboxylating)
MRHVPFEPLDPGLYREVVRRALAEDLGWGDVTTEATVSADLRAHGLILAKSECVIAGVEVAAETFRQLDPAVTFAVRRGDGDRCVHGDVVAEVRGMAASMLTAERTALNLMQRMTGIATLTRRFVDAAAGRIIILDTRKTTPTLRALEKYAVRVGGATNHRGGLFDAVLLKDNHVRLAGGVTKAVQRVRVLHRGLPIEVEAQTLAEVNEALAAKADAILLDNMTMADVRKAVDRAKGRAKIEISGGITLDRIPELSKSGADFVSIGALTHSAPAADISFEIEPL